MFMLDSFTIHMYLSGILPSIGRFLRSFLYCASVPVKSALFLNPWNVTLILHLKILFPPAKHWPHKKRLTKDSPENRRPCACRLPDDNAWYCGLPSYLLDKLQLVQNSAAQLVSGCPRRNHITPVLQLHWLPIPQRIAFKLCDFVFNLRKD